MSMETLVPHVKFGVADGRWLSCRVRNLTEYAFTLGTWNLAADHGRLFTWQVEKHFD